VFHLLGELVELGRNSDQWRLHLSQRMNHLVDARTSLCGEQFVSAEQPRFAGMILAGWLPAERDRLFEHLQSGGMARDPFHEPVQKLLFRSFTRRRCDLVPDEIWYASAIMDVCRQINVDDRIYSRCILPQRGWAHVLSFYRSWGGPRFQPRERLVVNLLHRELGRLWRQAESGIMGGLPLRLQQTVDLLFSGYSEKKIAASLNVRPSTAHDFVKRVYRHFGVSGRGELLTNDVCRGLLFRPALSPAYYASDREPAPGDFPKPPAGTRSMPLDLRIRFAGK
jgi:hypothetical protein